MSISIPLNGGFISSLLLITTTSGTFLLFASLPQSFRGTAVGSGAGAYRYSVSRGKYNRIGSTAFGVDIADEFRFTLRRERWYDRIAKYVGLVREWQTEDDRFDSETFIVSEDEQLLQALSRDSSLRARISDLLGVQKVKAVKAYGGRLWVKGMIGNPVSSMSDTEVADRMAELVLGKLRALKDRLVAEHAPLWQSDRDRALNYKLILQGICAVLGTCGVIAGYWASGYGLPHALVYDGITRHALQATAIVLALLLIAMLALIGRHCRTHIVLAGIILVAVPGAACLASALYEHVDVTADHGDSTTVRAHILRLYETHGRHSTTDHLVIDQWPDPRFDTDQRVYGNVYNALSRVGCVDLVVHPGALGDPWLSGIEPVDCSQ